MKIDPHCQRRNCCALKVLFKDYRLRWYFWVILCRGWFSELRPIYHGCRALTFALARLSCFYIVLHADGVMLSYIFRSFVSVAYTTLNKLLAIFFINDYARNRKHHKNVVMVRLRGYAQHFCMTMTKSATSTRPRAHKNVVNVRPPSESQTTIETATWRIAYYVLWSIKKAPLIFSRSYCMQCDQLLVWYRRLPVCPSICDAVLYGKTMHPTTRVCKLIGSAPWEHNFTTFSPLHWPVSLKSPLLEPQILALSEE